MKTSRKLKRRVPRCFLAPFVWLVVVLWLIERALWRALTGAGQLLGRLPVLKQIEAFAGRLPPWGAALLMLSPLLLAEPLKIEALRLFYGHHWMAGSTLLLIAKIGGTAFGARLYTVCRPALMRLRWFARGHSKFFTVKAWIENRALAKLLLRRSKAIRESCRAKAQAFGRAVSLSLRSAGAGQSSGWAALTARAAARMWSSWRRLGRQKARKWREERVV